MDAELPSGWTGVGDAEEATTYATRSPTELPPLPDVPLTGAFDWLTEPERELDWAIAGSPNSAEFYLPSVARLEALVAEQGIQLPKPFLSFLSSEKRFWIRSWTGCWLDLPTRLATLPGTDVLAIRFLNDQQGVVFWYLLVSPAGEDRGVVVSEDLWDTPEPWLDGEAAPPVLVAPSFEGFMLRYWLESEIAFRTRDGEALTDMQREYAERWRPHR